MESYNPPGDWAAIALSPDGTIRALSNSAEQTLGYSPGDLAGHSAAAIMARGSAFDLEEMLRIADEWGSWEGEIFYRHRSGQELAANARLLQLVAAEESKAGFLLLSTPKTMAPPDGTDPRLLAVASHLRKTAHELNNPLAVMMGFTQLMLLDGTCDGRMRADIERIFAEMKRLIRSVEGLHAYAVSLQKPHVDGEPALK